MQHRGERPAAASRRRYADHAQADRVRGEAVAHLLDAHLSSRIASGEEPSVLLSATYPYLTAMYCLAVIRLARLSAATRNVEPGHPAMPPDGSQPGGVAPPLLPASRPRARGLSTATRYSRRARGWSTTPRGGARTASPEVLGRRSASGYRRPAGCAPGRCSSGRASPTVGTAAAAALDPASASHRPSVRCCGGEDQPPAPMTARHVHQAAVRAPTAPEGAGTARRCEYGAGRAG